MNILDIILAVILVCSVVVGARQGLIRQACGVAGIILGIILAQRFSVQLAAWLEISKEWSQIVSFVVILLVVVLVFALIGWLFRKVFKMTGFGLWDKIGGVALALAKDALIIGVLLGLLANFTRLKNANNEPSKLITKSILYEPLHDYSQAVFGWVMNNKEELKVEN